MGLKKKQFLGIVKINNVQFGSIMVGALLCKFPSHRPVLHTGGWKKDAGPFTNEPLVAEARLDLQDFFKEQLNNCEFDFRKPLPFQGIVKLSSPSGIRFMSLCNTY